MKDDLYESGKGDTLIDSSLYPPDVVKYLTEERIEINKKLVSYTHLFEIGCMSARHLDQAITNEKMYTGIDIVQRYIDQANKKNLDINGWGSLYNVICYNALELDKLFQTDSNLNTLDKSKILLLFPFNSFGNLDDCEKMTQVLNRLNIDFMINSYKTDSLTNKFRMNYYLKSSMTNLQLKETEDSVVISSSENLNSKCFKEIFYKKRFSNVSFTYFGDYGKSIYGYAK